MSYKHLKGKLRVFLTGKTVAIVISDVMIMTTTCSARRVKQSSWIINRLNTVWCVISLTSFTSFGLDSVVCGICL